MDRISYTGPLAALKGRIIESIQLLGCDEDELLIAFTDDSYLLFVPRHTGYDGDLSIQQHELSDWGQLEIGWITEEEYDKRQAQLADARREEIRQRELKTLARLKRIYEEAD